MHAQQNYTKFSKDQLEKIGHTAIYLSSKIPQLSKTKLLKLFYILDEISIKKSGIPFLNLKYKVWKLGPVSEELFIDLSSDKIELLDKFIEKTKGLEWDLIIPKIEFSDDEFSDNDIALLDYVIERFGEQSTNELIKHTHQEGSLWHNKAKENNVLEMLQKGEIGNTEYLIDMSDLVSDDDRKKGIYTDFIEMF